MDGFITRPVAILAKEKGFDEVCQYLHCLEWSEDIGTITNMKYHRNSKINIKKADKNMYVTAPTQAELQTWLRDTHNIFVDVQTDCTTRPKFCFTINQFIGNPSDLASQEWGWNHIPNDDDWGLYSKYESALEAGLKKGLNLIK